MTTTIQVKTDASIVSKLRNAFTSPMCVLTESMQNARRANASEVVYTTFDDENILKITDNGDGMDDLQAFLTLSGSGWEQSVVEEEGAFGIGSFSMLYACSHIKVASNGKQFEGYTKDILERGEIDISPSSVMSGTQITMTGYFLDEQIDLSIDVHNALKDAAKGFSISVWCNSTEIERPHALDVKDMEWINSAVGTVSLAKTIPDEITAIMYGTSSYQLYYQGLPIGLKPIGLKPIGLKPNGFRSNIIHLDESLFDVRMPDRDVLIDHSKAQNKVEKALKELWTKILKKKKAELSDDDFANKLFGTLEKWGLISLLNDVPVLPDSVTFLVGDRPCLTKPYYDEDLTTGFSVTRENLDATSQKVLLLNSYINNENMTHWMYAYIGDYVCMTYNQLDKDHWVFDGYTKEIDEDNEIVVSVSYLRQESNLFSGDQCYFSAFLGEKVLMKGPLGEVSSDSTSVYVDADAYCVASNAGMYVPKGASDGWVVDQAESFINNDDYDETAAQRESFLFQSYLMAVNKSKEEALTELLNNSNLGLMSLEGKTVTFSFNEETKLVDSVEISEAA